MNREKKNLLIPSVVFLIFFAWWWGWRVEGGGGGWRGTFSPLKWKLSENVSLQGIHFQRHTFFMRFELQTLNEFMNKAFKHFVSFTRPWSSQLLTLSFFTYIAMTMNNFPFPSTLVPSERKVRTWDALHFKSPARSPRNPHQDPVMAVKFSVTHQQKNSQSPPPPPPTHPTLLSHTHTRHTWCHSAWHMHVAMRSSASQVSVRLPIVSEVVGQGGGRGDGARPKAVVMSEGDVRRRRR